MGRFTKFLVDLFLIIWVLIGGLLLVGAVVAVAFGPRFLSQVREQLPGAVGNVLGGSGGQQSPIGGSTGQQSTPGGNGAPTGGGQQSTPGGNVGPTGGSQGTTSGPVPSGGGQQGSSIQNLTPEQQACLKKLFGDQIFNDLISGRRAPSQTEHDQAASQCGIK